MFGLMWLAAGFGFSQDMEHFGAGFLPFLFWFFMLPIGSLIFFSMSLLYLLRVESGDFGARFKWWRLVTWLLTGAAYGCVLILIVFRPAPESV